VLDAETIERTAYLAVRLNDPPPPEAENRTTHMLPSPNNSPATEPLLLLPRRRTGIGKDHGSPVVAPTPRLRVDG
jgi:hypothetical protein